ncbi:uncharacterized protein LOC142328320 [Lycorma delicatula]|uniref:uncharacterized protein LOC142328320 n=1 Tax=Lycorma delicatula TaxID=130591 RepID=UPI003F51639F
MSYKVEVLTKPLVLGEGPHWNIATQTLYFVDIMKGSVHSYKPATNEHFSAVIGDGELPVSLIIPVEAQKDKFLISIKNDLAVIEWDGKSCTTTKPEIIASIEPKDNTNRLNDGKADAKGRLWAGTIGQPEGPDRIFKPVSAFYSISLEGDKNVKKHLDKIKVSNGLTWSSDNKILYYIDSYKFCISSYDFNIDSGIISNEKVVFDFKKNDIPGIPDGMTIDTEGMLFVANFKGGQVLRIDPVKGKIISSIPVPALQTTSVAFGGPNLEELYVTTANLNIGITLSKGDQENNSNGCLFKVTNLGVKGLPMFNVKFKLVQNRRIVVDCTKKYNKNTFIRNMSYKVEAVTKPLHCGEGPHWDILTQTLYFIEPKEGTVHSYKPSTKEHYSAVIGDGKRTVSIIIPVEGQKDKFIVSLKSDLAIITWDGKSSKTSEPEIITSFGPKDSKIGLNDGKVDAKGRLWIGSTVHVTEPDEGHQAVGKLYSIDNKKTITKQLDNITFPNGLTWSLDNKTFYYIDTFKFCISSYDYDIDLGIISNEKMVFNLEENGLPKYLDGMTIDAEGNLYVANFNGSQVLKIDPKKGELLSKISLPSAVTSVAFGGPDLDELYVTTAKLHPETFQKLEDDGIKGSLFKVTNLGVKGVPMFNFKLCRISEISMLDLCLNMSYKVEAVTKPLFCGEGPHWDILTQTLYFVDLGNVGIHSYKPSTNEHYSAIIGDGKRTASIIIPVEGQKDTFIISLKNDIAIITWDGKSSKTSEPEIIASLGPKGSDNVLNDGKVDAKGRLWIGSTANMIELNENHPAVGKLYSIDKRKNVAEHLDGIKVPNGLTWSLDNKTFYYIDSFKFCINSYDYDIESGNISNEKTAFHLEENGLPKFPDGMTIDAEGNLYVANFNGQQILKIDPKKGELLSKISIPSAVTSVAFGGPNLDELYVTTANCHPETYQKLADNGIRGCLHKVTNLGVKGVPMFKFRL